ncbi:WD40 repeat-like protein, partial [Suillus hirtellus]
SFSPDGTRIVSGSEDSTVRVWDAAKGLPLGEPFRGHTDSVWSVSFSPDGTRIVSGSVDSTVRVWNSATKQRFQEHIDIHPSAFSSDIHPSTPCDRETTVSTITQNHPTICFASNLGHALRDPDELLEDASHLNSNPVMLKDGWMKGAQHRLFFWVPPPSRERPFYYPGIVFTIPRAQEIDLSRMAHGENWSKCRDVCSNTKCTILFHVDSISAIELEFPVALEVLRAHEVLLDASRRKELVEDGFVVDFTRSSSKWLMTHDRASAFFVVTDVASSVA